VLVTGASRGIGRAIAVRFAAPGTLVLIHYGGSENDARETARRVEAAGALAETLQADITDLADVARLVGAVSDRLHAHGANGLDVLVNNVGVGGGGSIATVDPDHFERIFATNVRGPFFLTRGLAGVLSDGGRVVNTSSIVSFGAHPNSIAYAMSKAAVNSFTTSLAGELAPRGITVNAVAPGLTDTDFIARLKDDPELYAKFLGTVALGRLGRPEDPADVVFFLASPQGGWITGEVLKATGGMHLIEV
jgi:NAD(P)-dependent dehydrogenase (short-subunit alcohol dehydrogenase family)